MSVLREIRETTVEVACPLIEILSAPILAGLYRNEDHNV